MTQQERRIWLIRALLDERQNDTVAIPQDEAEQKRLLRGLMNVRPPMPVGREFLDVQDAYLQEAMPQKSLSWSILWASMG